MNITSAILKKLNTLDILDNKTIFKFILNYLSLIDPPHNNLLWA